MNSLTTGRGDEHSGDVASPHDVSLLEALQRGDEAAFMFLVSEYHPALVRLARAYVRDEATAEEVAQETWLAVLRGIDRFEGRSSLKTWLFRILINRAKTRAVRDARVIPFSSLNESEDDDDEPAVDPSRFRGGADPELPGAWLSPPSPWTATPEDLALSAETRRVIDEAIDALSPNQKAVITLHDIEGWSVEDICNALGISETNERVLLHRARSKVRAALERYLDGESAA